MTTMKAALYDGAGTMRVRDVRIPEAGPGDALVRVQVAGICGSDLQLYGMSTEPETLPAGHEVAGKIVEVGEGVDRRRVGERVAVESIGHGRSCGTCWYCRTGQFKFCAQMAPASGGGYAEYMVRRAEGLYTLTESLSPEEAGLVEPLAVSVHAVRRGEMRGPETVAVLGAGNIGLTAVAAARALGAGKVLATARHEHQAAMARLLGADDALPPDGPSFQEAVNRATDGRGADMTIETVGGKSSAALEQAVEVTRMQGRIVVLGGYRAPITLDWLPPLIKEQSFIFSSCYSVLDGRHDFEIAIELMQSGRVDLKQMVTHRFSLDDIQKGCDTAYQKTTGSIKVQLHT